MKKKAIGSLVLASAMAMGNMSVFAADATKNADGKYDPEITITIGKQLDENTGRYGDGEDINKNPMTELTRESLGINMETTLLGGDASNYETKLVWHLLVLMICQMYSQFTPHSWQLI